MNQSPPDVIHFLSNWGTSILIASRWLCSGELSIVSSSIPHYKNTDLSNSFKMSFFFLSRASAHGCWCVLCFCFRFQWYLWSHPQPSLEHGLQNIEQILFSNCIEYISSFYLLCVSGLRPEMTVDFRKKEEVDNARYLISNKSCHFADHFWGFRHCANLIRPLCQDYMKICQMLC